VSTTDLDAAARPFDRAAAQGAWRDGGWTFATGLRGANVRGGDVLDVGAFGPVASARRAGEVGEAGGYDALVEGGALEAPFLPALSFARGAAGSLVATQAGPFGISLAARGVGDVASDGAREGADGAGSARLRASLPLARGWGSGDDGDPWVHRIDPRLEVATLGMGAGREAGPLTGAAPFALPSGAAWTTTAGLWTGVGRFGSRTAVEADAAAGFVGAFDRTSSGPLVRGRLALSHAWLALGGESAHVFPAGTTPVAGHAFVVRARVGREDGWSLGGALAAREGVDPVIARALTDAPLEPTSGFLAAEGWTGKGRASVPLGSRVVVRGGADADLNSGRLVAAAGALELRDPCGCVVVRANGAHRIGRDGVDVWVTVDLPR
jgi:hypothetical protein